MLTDATLLTFALNTVYVKTNTSRNIRSSKSRQHYCSFFSWSRVYIMMIVVIFLRLREIGVVMCAAQYETGDVRYQEVMIISIEH